MGFLTLFNFGAGLHANVLLEDKSDVYSAVLQSVVASTPMTEYSKVFAAIGLPVDNVLVNGSEHTIPRCLNRNAMLGLNIIQAFENPKKERSVFEQVFTVGVQQEIMESSDPVEAALDYYERLVMNAPVQ